MDRLIFHLDMNAFFASVEQRFNPALRGKPIVVCGNPKKRTVVAACSYEAKRYGIQNGMAVFEAQRLCPKVALVGGRPDKYVDISQRIFALLATFTPQMEIFSIDEAFLDMTSTYRLFGATPEATAQLMKQRIKQAHSLTCSVGIGPNKLIAKMASDLKKPDGLVRVRPEEVPALMERLPIEDLCGVGPRLKAQLNDLGVITCADLGRASAPMLTRRFGLLGAHLQRMGQGRDESPVALLNRESLVKSMGHCYTLPRDTASLEEIYGTLLRLAEQVARRLRRDGYQGRTVGLTIRYADFSSLSHDRTLADPTDHGPRLYQAAQGLFIQHCDPLPQRVRLVGIRASCLIRHERQASFLPQERRQERLDQCLDQLAERFGEFTLARASTRFQVPGTSVENSARHQPPWFKIA